MTPVRPFIFYSKSQERLQNAFDSTKDKISFNCAIVENGAELAKLRERGYLVFFTSNRELSLEFENSLLVELLEEKEKIRKADICAKTNFSYSELKKQDSGFSNYSIHFDDPIKIVF